MRKFVKGLVICVAISSIAGLYVKAQSNQRTKVDTQAVEEGRLPAATIK